MFDALQTLLRRLEDSEEGHLILRLEADDPEHWLQTCASMDQNQRQAWLSQRAIEATPDSSAPTC